MPIACAPIVGLVWSSVAIAAWVLWIPIGHAAGGSHPGFLLLIVDSFLAALFVGGLESLLFGLAPLRYLDGEKIVHWRRPVWIVMYAISLFLFVHVMLRPDSGYVSTSSEVSFVAVIALFLAFGALSVGLWAYFRAYNRRLAAGTGPVASSTLSA